MYDTGITAEVVGWGFPWCGGGSIRCGSNKVWLEKVVAEQVRQPYHIRQEVQLVTGSALPTSEWSKGI